jgi:drug/metabolite transporter (DMT)-like permease
MPYRRFSDLFPVLSLLFVASIWGLFWLPLRWLDANGMDGLWSTLVGYSAALLLALPMLWRLRRELRDNFPVLTGIALASGWCNMAFILAVLEGHVVRVVLLFYLSPLWTVLLGHFILGERMTVYARVVMGVAMCGALAMLWEPALGFPWPRDGADWLALSAGFAFALSNVLVRKSPGISVANKAIATWWGAVLLALGFLAVGDSAVPQVGLEVYGGAVLLGLFGLALATLAVQYGVTHMPVHRSAVIMLFELVVATTSSQLLTDEVVRTIEWFGGALILAAAWLTARRQVEVGE